MTLNEVQDGVVAELESRFPDVEVFTEPPEGGFVGPCFFVKLLNTAHTQELNRRYRRVHTFDIQYFAAGAGSRNGIMQETAEQLYESMETIVTEGNICRGTGMRHEIADGVLHFYVEFKFLVYRPASDDQVMGTLERKEGLKS